MTPQQVARLRRKHGISESRARLLARLIYGD